MKLGRRIKKMVEIRGQALMFRRSVGPKSDEVSLCRMKAKEIMRIYLCEVSDIGFKIKLQIL